MKNILLVTSILLLSINCFGQKNTKIHLPSEAFSINLKDNKIKIEDFTNNINEYIDLNTNYEFTLLRSDEDKFGMLHNRYTVTVFGRLLEGNQIITHSKNGQLSSLNGEVYSIIEKVEPQLKIDDIENLISTNYPTMESKSVPVLTYIKDEGTIILCYTSTVYKNTYSAVDVYINSMNGDIIKEISNLHNAKANSIISGTVAINTSFENGTYYLSDETKNIHVLDAEYQNIGPSIEIASDDDDIWLDGTYLSKITVYGIFADFNNGFGDLESYPDLYFRLYHDGVYTGDYSWPIDDVSGTVSIDFFGGLEQSGEYTLQVWDEDTSSDDYLFSIPFYSRSHDLNYYNSSYGSVKLSFTNNTNPAVDAFWATSNTHDFYELMGWNGPDNNNAMVNPIVNLPNSYFTNEDGDVNQVNAYAFTEGEYNYIFCGSGNVQSSISHLVSQDIMAHEYTHLVINHSSELVYNGESGALNEALSDIHGELIERIAYGNEDLFYYSNDYPYSNSLQTNSPYNTHDWLVAEDIYQEGGYMRNMANPKLAGQPDTYLGEYWTMYDDDDNGVHTNSGVYNYWYYLLLDGGSGTNDNGYSYNVDNIESIEAAFLPTFSMLYYMTPNTNYFMAKDISLQICDDMGDLISQTDYQTVLDAWAAVGLGGECSNGAPNKLVLQDSYGDGWNGNSLSIEITSASGVESQNEYTYENGYSSIYCFQDITNKCVTFSWNEGTFVSECSWQLMDSTGFAIAGGSEGQVSTNIGCISGCTDETACNYSENVNYSDNSCEYPQEYYTCDETCVNDIDSDNVCDELEIDGCMDILACNYNSSATDNYNCEFADTYYNCLNNCLNDTDNDGVCDELEIVGCSEITACNYNPLSTDVATCIYNEEYYLCSGLCINDTDGDGICDELEIIGCQDIEACNYNTLATNEGLCTYAELNFDCQGDCIDTDADNICDIDEIIGCLNSFACNYDINATDEGECEFPQDYYDCTESCNNDTDFDGICNELEIVGCTNSEACNYNPNATDEGTCEFSQEYYLCSGACINDSDGDGICDELEIMGCTDYDACNYNYEATDSDTQACNYLDFELNYLPNSFIVNATYDVSQAIYTWYINGQLAPEIDGNYTLAEQNGLYELVIYDLVNQCEGSQTIEVYGVGITETESIDFTMVPNPAKDYVLLNFDLKGIENVEIEFTNTLGQQVKHIELIDNNLNEFRVETSDLSVGTYFVHLVINGIKQSKVLSIIK